MDTIRRAYSMERLSQLAARLETLQQLLRDQPLCVYATGSYGRMEAWEGSDIDLFFLHDVTGGGTYPSTSFIRVASRVIEATEEMGFPPFSGDGRYLEAQSVDEMERVLGSPQDDSLNVFTGRMLLLLESHPVLDEALYERLLRRIIGFYFRDFEDHETSFIPHFLTNDILRFWRTLTLNYEHHRLKLLPLTGAELERRKADSAIKNYKLKVSRLATCFSLVTHLTAQEPPVTPDLVYDLCRLTPQERFTGLRGRSAEADRLLDDVDAAYDRFLLRVQRPEDELRAHFTETGARHSALEEARSYGGRIYALLRTLTTEERMRFVVV